MFFNRIFKLHENLNKRKGIDEDNSAENSVKD